MRAQTHDPGKAGEAAHLRYDMASRGRFAVGRRIIAGIAQESKFTADHGAQPGIPRVVGEHMDGRIPAVE
jgi:hypothetical protein